MSSFNTAFARRPSNNSFFDRSRAGPEPRGRDRPEPSRGEPSRAGPSRAEASRAEPSLSLAEPGRAEPSRAEPSRGEPRRAEPGRAEPIRAEPSQTELIRAEPCQTEPSRAEPEATHTPYFFKNIMFYNELYICIPPSQNISFYNGFDDFAIKALFFTMNLIARSK